MSEWFERGKDCRAVTEILHEIEHLSESFPHFDPAYGFAHVVLSDLDLDDGGINACLGNKAAIIEYIADRSSQIADWDATNFHDPSADLVELLESVAATIDLLKGWLYVPEELRNSVM